jgi:hypothetical protein
MDHIGTMLEHEVPSGVTFLSLVTLGPPSYETTGYLATYRIDHREVAVVFFLVDLLVRKSPAAPKPRKKKKPLTQSRKILSLARRPNAAG